MTDDSAKKAILARRARFVAAAMMGAGMVSCEGTKTEPTVCLTMMPTPPEAAPTPCLSTPIMPLPPDGTGVTTDGGASDGGVSDAGTGPVGKPDAGAPHPCLSPARVKRPAPRICLDFSE